MPSCRRGAIASPRCRRPPRRHSAKPGPGRGAGRVPRSAPAESRPGEMRSTEDLQAVRQTSAAAGAGGAIRPGCRCDPGVTLGPELGGESPGVGGPPLPCHRDPSGRGARHRPGLGIVGDVVGDVVQVLDPVLEQVVAPVIGIVGDVVGDVVQRARSCASSRWSRRCIGIVGDVVGDVVQVLDPVVEQVVAPVLGIVGDVVGDVVQVLDPVVEQVVAPVIGIVGDVVGDVVQVLDPVVEQVVAPVIGIVGDVVGDVVQVLDPVVEQVVAPVIGIVGDVVGDVVQVLDPVVEQVVAPVRASARRIVGRWRTPWCRPSIPLSRRCSRLSAPVADIVGGPLAALLGLGSGGGAPIIVTPVVSRLLAAAWTSRARRASGSLPLDDLFSGGGYTDYNLALQR